VIVGTGQRQQTIGNIIVVDPRDGTLYDFTDLIVPPNTPKQGTNTNAVAAFVKSTDGGAHWTQPHQIAPFQSLGTVDPNTGQAVRTGGILPEVAIDPASGQLYVVWQQSTKFQQSLHGSSGGFDDEVMLSTSTDGGATWSSPAVIHKLASGLPTFTPTVAVSSDGTVGVTYYDFRNLKPGNTTSLPTDYWFSSSKDGFSTEKHISDTFNMLSAPNARGFFVGDYEGLATIGTMFRPFFVESNCTSFNPSTGGFSAGDPACTAASSTSAATTNTNPTDVFTTTVTP
jgi:hypothetical protein